MRRKRWPKIALGCGGTLVIAALVWVGLSSIDGWDSRERGIQTTCLSNLHFVGQALVLYRDDRGGFPPFSFATKGPGLKALVDAEYLEKVQGSPKALICPDNEVEADSYDMFEGKVIYNWYGYDRSGWGLRRPREQGKKTRYLANRNCPGNTMVTHCCYHRAFYGGNEAAWADMVLYLNGNAAKVNTVKTFPGLKEQ